MNDSSTKANEISHQLSNPRGLQITAPALRIDYIRFTRTPGVCGDVGDVKTDRFPTAEQIFIAINSTYWAEKKIQRAGEKKRKRNRLIKRINFEHSTTIITISLARVYSFFSAVAQYFFESRSKSARHRCGPRAFLIRLLLSVGFMAECTDGGDKTMTLM